MYRDEVELQVLEYLDMPVPKNWHNWSMQQQHQYTFKYFDNNGEFEPGAEKLSKVSTREIMYNLFMRNSNDKKLSTKINMIMDNHPDWQKGSFESVEKIQKVLRELYKSRSDTFLISIGCIGCTLKRTVACIRYASDKMKERLHP